MADTRDISMHFWATQEEYDLIQKNMALSGSTNLSAFLRKMAIDGMVIKLDMPEIQEMLHLLRRANANINQIARRLNQAKSEVAEEEWIAVKEELEALDREVAEVWQRLR